MRQRAAEASCWFCGACRWRLLQAAGAVGVRGPSVDRAGVALRGGPPLPDPGPACGPPRRGVRASRASRYPKKNLAPEPKLGKSPTAVPRGAEALCGSAEAEATAPTPGEASAAGRSLSRVQRRPKPLLPLLGTRPLAAEAVCGASEAEASFGVPRRPKPLWRASEAEASSACLRDRSPFGVPRWWSPSAPGRGPSRVRRSRSPVAKLR